MSDTGGERVRTNARRYVTLAAGWALIGIGGLLLFLPGPGLPILLGGLALLGREAAWARRLQGSLRAKLSRRGAGSALDVRNAAE